jgi:hypothetical protein
METARTRLEVATQALEGERAECARLKAGMPVPPSARAGRGRKAPASPAIASAPVEGGDGAKSVADVKASLADVLESEATKTAGAPKKKYRGSAGDD